MKIAIGNWRIGRQGGTEEWTNLMGETLRNMGHEVTLTSNPQLTDVYDLALINHLEPSIFNAKKKIYTVHGIIPQLEKPKPGADVYVGVSEEIANQYNYEHVIRNPINTDKFSTDKPINATPENILAISNNPLDEELLRRATQGMEFRRIGGHNRVSNVREQIEWADVVISLGRGCYEAMSMNRNVIVYDYNGGDGAITPKSYKEYRKHNCSGRTNRYMWTDTQIRQLIMDSYNPKPNFRELIIENHSPRTIAEQYLSIAKH